MFSAARLSTDKNAQEVPQDSAPPLHLFSPEHAAMSPSLQLAARRSESAREVKFLLEESQARDIESRLRTILLPDSHANPTNGNYKIATVYCDTSHWDVFHRRGRYRLTKFRARRYGQSQSVYLERKLRQKNRVRKHRSIIDVDQCEVLGTQFLFRDQHASRYSRQLQRHGFRPVCLIEYRRAAYVGTERGMPLRLTVDREICGGLISDWSFAIPQKTHQLLANLVVCEFKFCGSMPTPFKAIIHDLQLIPQGISKYRHCILQSGVLSKEIADHA